MKYEYLKKGTLLRLVNGDDPLIIFKHSETTKNEQDEWATSIGDVWKGNLVVLMSDGYRGPHAEFHIHHVESGTVGYVYGFEYADSLWEAIKTNV